MVNALAWMDVRSFGGGEECSTFPRCHRRGNVFEQKICSNGNSVPCTTA
jgi:hypothetical protein